MLAIQKHNQKLWVVSIIILLLITTLGCFTDINQLPQKPSGLKVETVSSGVRISWDELQDADTISSIRRREGTIGTGTEIASNLSSYTLEYLDTTGVPGNWYSYSISVKNSSGEESSGWSSMVIFPDRNAEVQEILPVVEIPWAVSDPSGTLTVINTAPYDSVIRINGNYILGAVRKGNEVTFNIRQYFPDFAIGGPMVIEAINVTEFYAHIDDLSKVRVDYSAFAAYGEDKYFRALLTGDFSGDYSFIVQNTLFNRGIEIREGSRNGQKVAYLVPTSTVTLYSPSNSRRTLYPVYVAYNTQTKSLVYYEPLDWSATQEVIPQINPSVVYQFPPRDTDISVIFNNIALPYATVIVQNNATRVAVFRSGLSELVAQSNIPGLESGKKDVFDVEATNAGTEIALNFALVTGQVSVVVRDKNNDSPIIRNGYIYELTLNFIGTDVMNPDHYRAVIEEKEAIDIEKFLIAY